jgi:large subunit ribosomal protein L25
MIELKAEAREKAEDNKDLRTNGYIPSVFYGAKEKSTSVKIKEGEFLSVYEEAGESTIIKLNDGKEEHEALIHDVQFDAITGRPIHADFYVIEKGKKLTVTVPIEFIGSSPAEKSLGGVLVKVMHEVEVEALPKDLPHELEADISILVDFESQLKASDIKLPEGVELQVEADEVIALVQEPKEEEEEPEEIDLDSIEVEEKGKKEEDGADGEGGGDSDGGNDKGGDSE